MDLHLPRVIVLLTDPPFQSPAVFFLVEHRSQIFRFTQLPVFAMVLPSFVHLYTGCATTLVQIPPPFVALDIDFPTDYVMLWSGLGTYRVSIYSSVFTNTLYLDKGWNTFAESHHLRPGSVVVFTYFGFHDFSVRVYTDELVEDIIARPPYDHLLLPALQHPNQHHADVNIEGFSVRFHSHRCHFWCFPRIPRSFVAARFLLGKSYIAVHSRSGRVWTIQLVRDGDPW